jgi:hypothetical protein
MRSEVLVFPLLYQSIYHATDANFALLTKNIVFCSYCCFSKHLDGGRSRGRNKSNRVDRTNPGQTGSVRNYIGHCYVF